MARNNGLMDVEVLLQYNIFLRVLTESNIVLIPVPIMELA